MSESSQTTSVTQRCTRQEIAGALGDLGVFLPIGLALIINNGLDGTAVFSLAGLLYVISGLYFKTIVPVQPMKTIGAYSVAAGLSPLEISTGGLLIGAMLFLIAATNATKLVQKIIPKSVVRGIQLTIGVMLLSQGVRLIIGASPQQHYLGLAEPYLSIANIGPLPVGLILGIVGVVGIFLLKNNPIAPSGIAVVLFGLVVGLVLQEQDHFAGLHLGPTIPSFFPLGFPDTSVITLALLSLALPQLPVTLGNAVFAQSDLSKTYFGGEKARRVTPRALTLSMGIANTVVGLFGGMPLCHGSGGLAAHYRFGARTLTSNLIIGTLFILIGLTIGSGAVALLTLIPFAVLGALLVFAGIELALAIQDLTNRNDLFVAITILGIGLAVNMGTAFAVGLVLANGLKWRGWKV